MKERVDVVQLNVSTAGELKAKGMTFNDTTPDSFRAQLRSAGFYATWRGKIGEEPWVLLEKYVGKLA